ncbi:MAG TPA: Uma2 family endonuclease, partial [Pyrinomonadaceae bacterium]
PPQDRRDVGRHELIDGRVTTKPASDRWTNVITSNFVIALGNRIQRGTHEIYGGDMLVTVTKNSVCYPNVVIVNGEPRFEGSTTRNEVLQNPTLLVEIVSSASRTTEGMRKLEGFLAIPSIKEVLLVNQNEMRVEVYSKQNPKQWLYRIYDARDDVISLDSIGCKISLVEIYTQVKLGESELSSKAVN